VQNWFINARKRSVITAEPLEPRVTEWNDRVEENTKDAKERHLQSNVGPFNGKTSPFIPRKDCEPVFMLQSNLATTERSEEGSSVNELKTLISLPKRQYDNIDVSEAIVLDDLDNFQSREDPRRSPNYYAIYLNNAYRLLSQDGNHKQLKNEDILPASDLRKSNPIDKNN
jgi:hypothetical protein